MPQKEIEDDYLPISIRFEGAWRYFLSFGWGRYICSGYFDHEYHEGEYVMFPHDSFSIQYKNSPVGLYLAKSVRCFVKAKQNPTTINGELARAQFLCTPQNHIGEKDPRVYDMTFSIVDSHRYLSYDFMVEGIGITNSITSELGHWSVETSPDSIDITISGLDDRGLEPTLLAILYMNRAKYHLDQIRKQS